MQLLLANPRGFCAGVVRAIAIVERALELHGAPVYVFHEIVHNGHVVAGLRDRGAIFVDEIDAIPPGAVTIFSAHGVANTVLRQARSRGLNVSSSAIAVTRRWRARWVRSTRRCTW